MTADVHLLAAETKTSVAAVCAVSVRFIPDRVARPGHNVWGSLVATASASSGGTRKLSDLGSWVERQLEELGLSVDDASQPWPSLSEGQAKRFALAQAMLAKPDLLLVDEPMANLDERAEVQQRNAMRAFAKGRGVIITAQRSSTVAGWSDMIKIEREKERQSSGFWDCELIGTNFSLLCTCLQQLMQRRGWALNRPSPTEYGAIYALAVSPVPGAEYTPDASMGGRDGYRIVIRLPDAMHTDELIGALLPAGITGFSRLNA